MVDVSSQHLKKNVCGVRGMDQQESYFNDDCSIRKSWYTAWIGLQLITISTGIQLHAQPSCFYKCIYFVVKATLQKHNCSLSLRTNNSLPDYHQNIRLQWIIVAKNTFQQEFCYCYVYEIQTQFLCIVPRKGFGKAEKNKSYSSSRNFTSQIFVHKFSKRTDLAHNPALLISLTQKLPTVESIFIGLLKAL